MKPKAILPLGIALLGAGCTLAPRYTRPTPPAPAAWAAEGAPAASGATAPLPWQEYFTDPGMRAVITRALAHNRDLRVAALTVEKVQALYRIQRSELLPGVGVMANGQKVRVPEKMHSDGKATYTEQTSVQVGVMSWELDFFGRLRSLKAKALNQYLAMEQARSAAELGLVATVAQAWLALAADQENLRLAQSTLESQSAYLELIGKSRDLGVASDLELNQARSQVEAARLDLARCKGLVALDRNALELLAGMPVPEQELPRGFEALEAQGDLKDLPPGLPSEVLLARPDILMAEYELKAATANIGAARAAFFPRISLTAGMGSMSPELSGLFGSGTRTWSFTPQIVAPIFAGGSLLANLRVSKADREIALAQYDKAIQSAFREVSDALIRRRSLTEQLEAQRALVDALDATHRLASARYKEGLDGYLGVLVAQRSLYAAQQGLVALRLAYRNNQVALYKALGGRTASQH